MIELIIVIIAAIANIGCFVISLIEFCQKERRAVQEKEKDQH